jgi:hypothetical protein
VDVRAHRDGDTKQKFWIGVVSRSHVEVGVKGGFIQLSHGKKRHCRSFEQAMA